MAADRVTRVSLTANVSNYITGMNQAAAATRATGTAAERLAQQRESFDKLGKGLLSIGAVAAASVAISVKKFADFDQAISNVQAATHASAATMGQLRDAAIDAGAKTVYSATEAANAIEELSKAGLTSKDILGGGLAGALNLAAAGGLEVADAAQQTAITLKQFNLNGSQASHVADLLAAGAGKAVGDVSDLSAALGQAGLVANQTGLSVEETTGVLAAFADKGLLGSDAGTSLKTMLQSLTPSSKEAADEFKKLGISAYDAQGDFVGIADFAGQYQQALKKLSPEQQATASKIIFGSDAVRAANVLYTEGASGIEKYINQTNDTGYAAETAAIKLDNLKGDLEQLGGSLDTALIKTGSGANGALRDLTQGATGLVNAFGQAPAGVQQTALALGTVVAASALVGGGFLAIVPKVAAARVALQTMNVTSTRLAKGIGIGGGVVAGLAVATAAISGLGTTANLTSDQVSKLNAATKLGDVSNLNSQFTGGGGFFDLVTKDSKGMGDALEYLSDSANSANRTVGDLLSGVGIQAGATGRRFKAQFAQIGTTLGELANSDLPSAADGFNKLVKAAGGGNDTAEKLLKTMPDYASALTDLASGAGKTLTAQQLLNLAQGKGRLAAQLAVTASKQQADGLAELSGTATNAEGDIQDLADAISNFGKAQFDVNSTQRDFQAAIDDATAALKENGRTLDVGTEKGRANAAALDTIGSSALASASAIYTSTGSQKAAAAAVSRGRSALIAQAQQFGLTKQQAIAYADRLGLIPKNVNTAIKVTGIEAAAQKTAELRAQYNALPKSITTVLNVQRKESNTIAPYLPETAAALGIKNKKAVGGQVRGPGSSTSDSIPTLLSNGEFVVKASSVQKYGLGTLAALNAGSLPRFAKGGPVAVGAAKRKLDDAEAAQKRSQAEYDRIKSAAAKGRLETAKARTAAAEKALKAAQDAPTGASSSDRISFRSAVRAGEFDSGEGVRSLYSMGQDASAYSSKARKAFIDQANRSEVRMLKLEKASDKAGAAVEKAADKLGDLKDKSSSLASSIASNLSGQGVSDFGSASSFARGQSRTAATLKQLAPVLDKLRKKGLSPALIAQIAGLAPVEALRMAKSFDALSGAGIKSVNADYKSVQSTSAAIGKQVADANYGAQIKAAQTALADARKNAKTITTELKTQGLLLRKVVGKGLGLKGYAAGGYTGVGSVNQVAGIVHAGEFVANARATANPRNRMVLEAMNRNGTPGYSSGGYVRPVYMRGGGSGGGIDVPTLVAALKQIPRDVTQRNEFKPMHNLDGATMATILGRELNREFAGMNR
ncbi:phage tail tape measure protein [Frondihabitans sp. 4ASC-45]|uniref:phage tail tape measure protein n=1 Tax=Frondihabitans sp. 4ASC-45 TaxID=3111636 RepID=UPI003C264612